MYVGTQIAAEPGDPAGPTTTKILEDIHLCKETLTAKIDYIPTDISLIRHNLDKFRSRVSEAEDRISQLEDSTRSDFHALQLQVKVLQEKAIDTENCLRQSNIHILGLPEKAEGPRPAEFVEVFLSELLDLCTMPLIFVVKRAHRIPPMPPSPGAPARPILLRLLNYYYCDRILAAARPKQDLRYENAKILPFPDCSPEVQQCRCNFTEVRKWL